MFKLAKKEKRRNVLKFFGNCERTCSNVQRQCLQLVKRRHNNFLLCVNLAKMETLRPNSMRYIISWCACCTCHSSYMNKIRFLYNWCARHISNQRNNAACHDPISQQWILISGTCSISRVARFLRGLNLFRILPHSFFGSLLFTVESDLNPPFKLVIRPWPSKSHFNVKYSTKWIFKTIHLPQR